MPDKPLLIFPEATLVEIPPQKPRGGGGKPPPTHREKQFNRIDNLFSEVISSFVLDEPGDVERVLVMETSNRIEDLQKAVKDMEGLEWLAEVNVDDIDLHDLYDEKTGEKIKGGRFYLLSSNKAATENLLRHWKQYKETQKLDTGLGRLGNVFEYLLTIRLWNRRDRLLETGILERWKEDYQEKAKYSSSMKFEIELHYGRSEKRRAKNEQEITQAIEKAKGKISKSICINEIAFHALKAELPINAIGQIIQHDWDTESDANLPPVFKIGSVKYFRPIGQHTSVEPESAEYLEKRDLAPVEDKPPVLALLDGPPLLRHEFLEGRIIFHDPDEYSQSYEPLERKHGTAMASLICHGDLQQSQTDIKSLSRPIYARPVMKYHPMLRDEMIPEEHFQEDIMELAVREMFEGENPSTPNIKVINLSLGNLEQQYLHEMSPWAKLLDWLSFKYKVLFIVSAGNYGGGIQIENPTSGQKSMLDKKEKKPVLTAIDKNQRNHRLLSPAESMNALTVGALQSDSYGGLDGDIRGSDPIEDENLPAPYSRIGPGYRGTVKPDIFTSGGRLLYDINLSNKNQLDPVFNSKPPGVQTAYPSVRTEQQLSNTVYKEGTSNAAAIASHGAGHIFEMLDELRGVHTDRLLPDFDAVLIKTLLVHSASQGHNRAEYKHLKTGTNSSRFKSYLSRFLGYGNINLERVLECTEKRATAIGCGYIRDKERYRFVFPLPVAASIKDYLRLTVTLGWFSPINPLHIGVRRAKLFFASDSFGGSNKRQEADWQQVRNGTVQHEIFELDKNNLKGDTLKISVECAAGAGELNTDIPYGLAVTLEIAPEETVDVYQLVQQQIAQQAITV